MLSATKIRLYPTAEQEQLLAAQFGCARFVWNRALAMKRAAWQERKESLSRYTIKGMLPVWKDGEFPWLKDADPGWSAKLLHLWSPQTPPPELALEKM